MFIDYRKKGNYYECTTVATFKDICDKVRSQISLLLISTCEIMLNLIVNKLQFVI